MAMEIVVKLLQVEPKGRHGFELLTFFCRERCSRCPAQNDLPDIVRNGLVATPCPVLDDAPFGIVDTKSEGRLTDWRGVLLPCPAEWFFIFFFLVHDGVLRRQPLCDRREKSQLSSMKLGVVYDHSNVIR